MAMRPTWMTKESFNDGVAQCVDILFNEILRVPREKVLDHVDSLNWDGDWNEEKETICLGIDAYKDGKRHSFYIDIDDHESEDMERLQRLFDN